LATRATATWFGASGPGFPASTTTMAAVGGKNLSVVEKRMPRSSARAIGASSKIAAGAIEERIENLPNVIFALISRHHTLAKWDFQRKRRSVE
jgi:hypothetical protein